MTVGFRIQRAGEPDIAELMAIFAERRRWLQERESDQWVCVDTWRPLVRYLIRHGNVWVLVTNDDQEEIVGTITLTTEPDFDFWTDEQRAESALYVSKLATAPAWGGQDLGGLMLEWAVGRAARKRFERLRLDTWRASAGLHEYYAKRGWTYLDTVELGHRKSGTLFERPTRDVTVLTESPVRGVRSAALVGASRP